MCIVQAASGIEERRILAGAAKGKDYRFMDSWVASRDIVGLFLSSSFGDRVTKILFQVLTLVLTR